MNNAVLSCRTKAKINLSLNITGKRNDGYHLLHSVVAFCGSGDIIHIVPDDDLSVSIDGAYAEGLDAQSNSMMQAALLLKQRSGCKAGARMLLDKRLPVASGIGGGSGDAAATLHLLNQYWQCGYDLTLLQQLALPLGADMPVCLYGKACIMEGIGEKITPVTWDKPLYVVLVNPCKPLHTKEVFSGVTSGNYTKNPCNYLTISTENVSFLHNDLQQAACLLCPEIEDILTFLSTTDYMLCTRMSGSGATCFAIYNNSNDAHTAMLVSQRQFPHYWHACGKLT